MRSAKKKFPKCSYCGQECYAYGFQGELIGGCEEMRSKHIIEYAKKVFNIKTDDQGNQANNSIHLPEAS